MGHLPELATCRCLTTLFAYKTLYIIYLCQVNMGDGTRERKAKDATANERKEHVSRTKSRTAMIQGEWSSAFKTLKKALQNANGRKVHVGMFAGSVPSSELLPEGGWPELLLIPSTGDVFGAGPLPF